MTETSFNESSELSSDLSNEFFNEQWQLYQKVLNENYMGHTEIYGTLHDFLVNYYNNKAFNILDLGCGDASFSSQVLLDTKIYSYCGIDLSEPALRIARGNMEKVPGEKTFIQENLFDLVLQLGQNLKDNFDVILASFSLHHLSLEQKECLISQLPNLLKANGVFLLIDIVRLPGENREAYIRRYLENVRQYWSLLTPQEFFKVEEHISSSDFPETQETLYSLAQKYKFSQVDCLYRDPLDTTQLLCFCK